MNYTHLKDLISQYTGLEKDALHIHAALFIYILVAFLVRKSPRSALPWLAVFVIEIANEAHDVWDNWGAPAGWIIGESGKDLWNTMLWPTVLLIAVRVAGWRAGRNGEDSGAAASVAPEEDAAARATEQPPGWTGRAP